MTKIELKIGRDTVRIDEKDVVMDNGACIQVLTKKKVDGWDSFPIKMSKKLFGDMKKLCFLVTDDSLIKCAKDHYDGRVQLYKFDIQAMLRAGYKPIE